MSPLKTEQWEMSQYVPCFQEDRWCFNDILCFKKYNFNKVDFEPTSYVFKVKGFDSIDVKTAKVATAGFEKIGLN